MSRSLFRRVLRVADARSLVGVVTALAIVGACGAGISASPPEQETFQAPQSAVEIAFLNVGQGDAALITAPDGRRVLVDGGPRASSVAAYLRARGIDTLDLVVVSHNHADHIGGLGEVFGTVAVRNYMENGVPSATDTYNRLVDVVAQSGAVVLSAEQRSIGLGELRIHVLPSPPGAVSHNGRSIGLVVQLGDFYAMFTGDAEEETLAWWLEQPLPPQMSGRESRTPRGAERHYSGFRAYHEPGGGGDLRGSEQPVRPSLPAGAQHVAGHGAVRAAHRSRRNDHRHRRLRREHAALYLPRSAAAAGRTHTCALDRKRAGGPMMTEDQIFVVDRIEDSHLVLAGDNGTEVVLAKRELPVRVGESTVLRVQLEDGKPDWTTARIDAAEQTRRLESAKKRMDELRKSDPGGDLEL
ncbi:hypothetical protein BH23GEM2_BH23GEM2_06180 [soil metagenome]